MRILFLTENFPPEVNAAATRVYERALYWVRWGHDVTIVTCAPNFPQGKVFDGYGNKPHQVEDMDGIRVVRVKTFIAPNTGTIFRTLDFLSFMASGVVASLFEPKPDVVAATSPQFFSAVAGWMVGVGKRVPFVFEVGDLWPASIKAVGAMRANPLLDLVEQVELFLYRQAAHVVVLTSAFKDDIAGRGIDPAKITVVINGVDVERYGPQPADGELSKQLKLSGCFTVGYIGTLGMAHGLEKVLDAAERLKNHPDIRFLFVGPGAVRDQLIKNARSRGLDNVVFVPRQPKEMMPAYWSLCDLALVHLKDTPVFKTVIPSKIFEAMGMGRPILLAAPEGEASKIVLEEQAGLHIPAENPDQLVDAIIRLEKDSELRKTLANNSLKAAPRYSRETQARKMLAVFSGVVAQDSQG